MKSDIPVQESDQVQEARAQKRQKLNEKKEESRSLLEGGSGHAPSSSQQPAQERVMPVKSEKIANRNDKVTVQYPDGRVLKDVKYKKVEDDIAAGRCIVIEQ